MKSKLEKLSEAYVRYALNPSTENLQLLQEFTEESKLTDILSATETMVGRARSVRILRNLRQAIGELRREPEIVLLQKKKLRDSPNQLRKRVGTVKQHLSDLYKSIRKRIRVLTKGDEVRDRVRQQLFGLCCRRYQEKIRLHTCKLLGPHSYELAQDPSFIEAAQNFARLSECEDARQCVKFFIDHVHELQDRFLPGEVLPEQLCQLMIVTLATANNPELIDDLKRVDKALTKSDRRAGAGDLMQAASTAVYLIQKEALPDVRRELAQLPRLAGAIDEEYHDDTQAAA